MAGPYPSQLSALAVEHRHLALGIALTRGGAGRDGAFQLGEVVCVEVELQRFQRLLEACGRACADQRDDVLTAREHPGDRQLGDRRPPCLGQRAQTLYEREVAGPVLAGEARRVRAKVRRLELALGSEVTADQTAAENAVGRDRDAQLAARRKDLRLDAARDQGVLDLQIADRMRGGCTA